MSLAAAARSLVGQGAAAAIVEAEEGQAVEAQQAAAGQRLAHLHPTIPMCAK